MDFPGGHKGKETAVYACVFIFFTLIGYCGVSRDPTFPRLLTVTSDLSLVPRSQAHHQKIYALVLYSVIIFVFLGGHVILWGVKPEFLILDPESRTVYAVSGLFLILMVIGIVLSWQIRKHSTLSCQEQTSPTMEQMTSLSRQKMNNNQLQAIPASSSSSSYIHMVTRPGTMHRQIPGSFQ